jgi:hypothetical protein
MISDRADGITRAGFTVSFRLGAPTAVLVVFVVLWVGAVMTLQVLPVLWQAQKFAVPLSPYTPAAGMFLNLHLIGAQFLPPASMVAPARAQFLSYMWHCAHRR